MHKVTATELQSAEKAQNLSIFSAGQPKKWEKNEYHCIPPTLCLVAEADRTFFQVKRGQSQ